MSLVECVGQHSRLSVFSGFLFFLLGLSSWLLVNGLWLQLPILVQSSPEGPGIAAYMSIALQLSNFVALGYVVVQSFHPIRHSFSISAVLLLAIVVAVLLALFWDTKISLAGSQHSVGLLVLMFFAGVVGSTSVVLYFPFTSLYNLQLTSAVSTGMGFTGLIPSVLAIIENPGGEQRFSIETFFLLICILLAFSLVAFLLIINHPSIEMLKQIQQMMNRKGSGFFMLTGEPTGEIQEASTNNKVSTYELLLIGKVPVINQFFICTLNFFLLAILPFCTVGYEDASILLMWLSILGMIGGTLGRFTSAYYQYYRVTFLSVIVGILWIFLVVMSFLGKPGHVGEQMGWVVVLVNACFSFVFGYEDTIIYMKVAHEMDPHLVERATRLVGSSNQVGAFVGSTVAFVLVATKILSYR